MKFSYQLAEWAEWLSPLLINHLWQATLFSLIAWLAAAMARKSSARARYLIWLIAFVKFVIPSALLISLPISLIGIRGFDPMRQTEVASTANESNPPPSAALTNTSVKIIFQITEPLAPPAIATNSSTSAAEDSHHGLYLLLMIGWLSGTALLILWWMMRRWWLARLLRMEHRFTSGREAEVLQRVRMWLGIRREVGLIVSNRVKEPGVWRAWRPVILLPEGLVAMLSDEELEVVMIHELMHIRHHDNLIGALQMIVCGLFWFHPLIWLIDRRLLEERELLCDEKVIQLSGEATTYAECLWKIAQFGFGWPIDGISRAVGSNLRRRIERMLSDDYQLRSLLHWRITGVTVVASLIILAVALSLFTRDWVQAEDNQIGLSKRKALRNNDDASTTEGIVPNGIRSLKGLNHRLVDFRGANERNRPQPVILTSDWKSRLDAAADHPLQFEKAVGVPLKITNAKAKVVKFNGCSILNCQVMVENQGDRGIAIASFQYGNLKTDEAINYETYFFGVNRGQSALINTLWFFKQGSDDFIDDYENNLAVKIIKIRYVNELYWEKWIRKFRGDDFYDHRVSNRWPKNFDIVKAAPEFVTRIDNTFGAPVTITDAVVKIGEIAELSTSGGLNSSIKGQMDLVLANHTDHRVTECDFVISSLGVGMERTSTRFGRPAARAEIGIEPQSSLAESILLGSRVQDLAEIPNNYYLAHLLTIGFEDGSYWSADMLNLSLGIPPGYHLAGKFSPPLPPSRSFLSSLVNLVWGRKENSSYEETTDEDPPEVNDLVDKTEVSSLPKVKNQWQPHYTIKAKAKEVSGTVILSIVFRSDGRIGDIKVVKPMPEGLTEEAITAAKRITFEPAKKDGLPVSIRTNIEYQFVYDPREPRQVYPLIDQSRIPTKDRLISRPQVIYQERPDYTPQARKNRVKGLVQLSVIFGADGRLRDLRVLRGLPDGLTEKAIEAAKKIRYRPAQKMLGTPVDWQAMLEYNFSLE